MFNLSETTVQLSHGGQRFFVKYTLGAGFKSKKHAGGRREVFASLFNFSRYGSSSLSSVWSVASIEACCAPKLMKTVMMSVVSARR